MGHGKQKLDKGAHYLDEIPNCYLPLQKIAANQAHIMI